MQYAYASRGKTAEDVSTKHNWPPLHLFEDQRLGLASPTQLSWPTGFLCAGWPVAGRSGIPCRTACGIRLLTGTVSDNL